MKLKENINVKFSPYDIYVMGWAVNAAMHMMKMNILQTDDPTQQDRTREKLNALARKFEKVLPSAWSIRQFPTEIGSLDKEGDNA